jgi:hypothetical protein
MFKTEKKLKEEIFFLSHIYLILKHGLYCEDQEELEKKIQNIDNKIKDLVKKHSPKNFGKIQKSISKINLNCGLTKIYSEVDNSHKIVLILYHILINLKMNNYNISEDVENNFEELLEIEHKQQIDEESWNKLNKSSEKQAIKILNRLQELNWFLY